MFCSDETIEKIKQKVNIIDYIGKREKLSQAGDLYKGKCPFHKTDVEGFTVNEASQTYDCFECGKSGDVINFAMNYYHLSFADAVCGIALLYDVNVDRDVGSKRYIQRQKTVIEINDFALKYYKKELETSKNARNYLLNRGLTEETIEKFQLGYVNSKKHIFDELKKQGFSNTDILSSGLVSVPNVDISQVTDATIINDTYDMFYSRIIFPILNECHVPIGFGGRIMTDKKPKYINSKETIAYDKSCNVFGLNFAKKSKEDYFLLCEGYMDVIAMHQAGFDNAAASLGTALTVNQVHKLSKYKKKFILAYDTDEAGINAVKRAIPILDEYKIDCKVLNLQPYKDPDEFIKNCGKKEFQKRIENATNAKSWLVKNILNSAIDYEKRLTEIANMFE